MRKAIPFKEDQYFKLLEIKAKLRAETWDELVDKLYAVMIKWQPKQ